MGFLVRGELWEGDSDIRNKGCVVGFAIQVRVVSGVVVFLVLEREVTFQMEICVLLLAR